jgi:predicted dehydrogenase
MAIDLTPEQKEVGKANFERTVGSLAAIDEAARKKGVSRREFMKGLIAAGATVPVGAAAYFGYEYGKVKGRPVKAALIGAGDEGGVLAGEHNPEYLELVAVCDIRPTNQERIFKGQPGTPRKGLNNIYGAGDAKKIKVFEDYLGMLKEKPEIEAVVIALPLHLHASAAIACMEAGKERGKPIHVLCEKLMARNIGDCKKMIQVAKDTGSILSIGHQRHYSLLYAHAVEVLKSGVLGDIKHIRALWHRNNGLPVIEGGREKREKIKGKDGKVREAIAYRDSWRPAIPAKDRAALEKRLKDLDYVSMEELVRWRLYQRTGGGLMAELGSHQLDACSIFLDALQEAAFRKKYGDERYDAEFAGKRAKTVPLNVTGVGGKYFYQDEREIEDHVFVTYEFPGPTYWDDPLHKKVNNGDDVVVVTYSSISTNSFEPYGECVMGTRGSLIVEQEQNAYLFPERGGRSLAVTVTAAGGGAPALDSSATTGPAGRPAQIAGQTALGGPVSRGYREEMEHFAYCVRMLQEAGSEEDKEKWRLGPRCHGKIAMTDAIIALTSNLSMQHHKRVHFDPAWFDPDQKDAVPETDKAVIG